MELEGRVVDDWFHVIDPCTVTIGIRAVFKGWLTGSTPSRNSDLKILAQIQYRPIQIYSSYYNFVLLKKQKTLPPETFPGLKIFPSRGPHREAHSVLSDS